jgi:hypothetical protein
LSGYSARGTGPGACSPTPRSGEPGSPTTSGGAGSEPLERQTLTVERPPGSDKRRPSPGERSPGPAVVALVVLSMFLLMAFSITAVLLKEPALATIAGTALVSLAVATVHRVLPQPPDRSSSDAERLDAVPPDVEPPQPR